MAIQLILEPVLHDLGGGFGVRRLLPSAVKQGVGPFVFFDHFGPVVERPQDNHDVRPHPHIGLATVTYLFDGAMMHRDNLGFSQRIEPGAVNWMTAGRGIVHSERKPDDLRDKTYPLHGLQLWAALPLAHEEAEPAFSHTPAHTIPEFKNAGTTVRVLIGNAFGLASPVHTFQPTLYLDVAAQAGSELELEASQFERAVYAVSGSLEIAGQIVAPMNMALLVPGTGARIAAPAGARYVIVGGAPLDGHRHLWWNYVSSSRERIERAKQAWLEQKAGKIPGESEWIPLPAR